ncbi:MAG TPA: hypothetical protein VGP70_19965 [Actinomadura sp.]|nr:hypothetical protein [Actinomadura sp.]
MLDMPFGGGNCGGAAMATLFSGTGGGAIRAGRWKAILLIGWVPQGEIFAAADGDAARPPRHR